MDPKVVFSTIVHNSYLALKTMPRQNIYNSKYSYYYNTEIMSYIKTRVKNK